MIKTYADLFTGFGGASIGAIDAGLVPIWGIEKDPDLYDVANANASHYLFCCDVRDVNFNGKYARPNWLHASPPCTTATVVNSKKESQEDIDLARSICRAIEILQPEYFSLENVEGYRYYKSFELIKKQLTADNYNCYTVILDASDYGVPQSRKRLFLIASKNQNIWAWNELLKSVWKKVSWYDAITDLIPLLPVWHLTESQRGRLYKEYPYDNPNLAIQNSGSRKDKDGNPTNTIRLANEPIWTMRAMSGNVRPNPHQVTLIIDGKVLRPTIQCYARWQSFPDSYQFSGDFKLDMKGIGNAIPPLMFKQIIEAVLN